MNCEPSCQFGSDDEALNMIFRRGILSVAAPHSPVRPPKLSEVKLSHPIKSCSCLNPVSPKRGLSLLVVLWLASTIPTLHAAITFAQANYAVPQTPQTTVTVPYTAAQGAGNLNVVVVGWADTTAQVVSVTDVNGNAYQLAVGPTQRAGAASQSIYYAKNIVGATAGRNSVMVTFSPAASFPDVRILEYGGIDPVNPLDVAVGASGSSATSSSGAVTTTNATDLLIGANDVATLTSAPGTGFTQRLLTSPDGDIVEDTVVTATGSYSATAALTGAGWWVMQMVAFRAAGIGSPDTQPPTAPTGLTPTVVSGSQINLSWTASTDNVGVTG